MLSQAVKQRLSTMARELYHNNTKVKPILYCSNGIFKIAVAKPAPKHKGDNYCFLEMFEYNKDKRRFEYVSAYGDVSPQFLSFELRERFKLD